MNPSMRHRSDNRQRGSELWGRSHSRGPNGLERVEMVQAWPIQLRDVVRDRSTIICSRLRYRIPLTECTT
ncbi:protein of unknown function (plasmid) [Pararobbsia alpina]